MDVRDLLNDIDDFVDQDVEIEGYIAVDNETTYFLPKEHSFDNIFDSCILVKNPLISYGLIAQGANRVGGIFTIYDKAKAKGKVIKEDDGYAAIELEWLYVDVIKEYVKMDISNNFLIKIKESYDKSIDWFD